MESEWSSAADAVTMPRESSVVDQPGASDSALLQRGGGSWDRDQDEDARVSRGKKKRTVGKKLHAVGSSWDRDQDHDAAREKKEQSVGKKPRAVGISRGRSWDQEQEKEARASRGKGGQQGRKLQTVGTSWDRDHEAERTASWKKGQRGQEWEIGQDRSASDYQGGEKLLARRNGMLDSMDEGVAQGWLSQHDRENPFRRDPLSMDTYRSIAEPRTQQMMWKVSKKLDDYSKRHGGVLGQQSHMTYEQILQGMFIDDEVLVPVRPLMIANYRKCDATAHGWPVEDEKFGVRVYLTNKRVFILDADLHKISTLDRRNLDDKNFWVVDRITCAIRTIDELFFYPIPLENITGMTLDIRYETRVSAWLYGNRPYWAVCWFCVGFIATVIGTLEALIVWGTVDRAFKGDSGQFVPVFVEEDGLPSELNTSFSYEWSHAKYHGNFAAGLDLRQLLTLLVGFACCCCAPCAYFSRVSYTRSQFRPRMKQRRQILLGATDPITQEQKAYKLLLDHRYETFQIKEYVHLMQRLCPVVAGTVLQ